MVSSSAVVVRCCAVLHPVERCSRHELGTPCRSLVEAIDPVGRTSSFVHHCDDDDLVGRREEDELVREPLHWNSSNIVKVGNRRARDSATESMVEGEVACVEELFAESDSLIVVPDGRLDCLQSSRRIELDGSAHCGERRRSASERTSLHATVGLPPERTRSARRWISSVQTCSSSSTVIPSG